MAIQIKLTRVQLLREVEQVAAAAVAAFAAVFVVPGASLDKSVLVAALTAAARAAYAVVRSTVASATADAIPPVK